MIIIGDESLAADTVVWTAGNQANPIVRALGVELTRRDQIPVSSDLRSAENPRLVGGGRLRPDPRPQRRGLLLPADGPARLFARGSSWAATLPAAIRGTPLQPFDFKTLGSLAALGYQLAVAEVLGHRFLRVFWHGSCGAPSTCRSSPTWRSGCASCWTGFWMYSSRLTSCRP